MSKWCLWKMLGLVVVDSAHFKSYFKTMQSTYVSVAAPPQSRTVHWSNEHSICWPDHIPLIVRFTRFGSAIVSAGQAGRINAFLKRSHKWGLCKDLVTLNEFLIQSGSSLFRKTQSLTHCLNLLLPSKKTTDYELRNKHCKYVLPQCNFDVFKRSFVNWSIFTL